MEEKKLLYALVMPCFLYFSLCLSSITFVLAKPDLEKAYKDGLLFAKNKVQENASILKPRVGVCHSPLPGEDMLKCLKGAKAHEFKLAENKQEKVDLPQKGDKIYVFISFSMPKASLDTLLKDAEKYNATLVLRGLKNNSFKETAKVIQDFYGDHKGEGVGFEINPELFLKYKISYVPVFLNLTNSKRLSGNVTLSYAAKKLKEEQAP